MNAETPGGAIGNAILSASCPTALGQYERVVLGHGSGGRLSQQLLRDVFLPELGAQVCHEEDQATFEVGASRLAFTTDGFVVSPMFFPGGNIGDLAVNGTVNDLAVGGAAPLKMSAAFVIEEGLSLDELRRVVRSMGAAARSAGVSICTGDTKVVERGKGDGVYITTTGVGVVRAGSSLSAKNARPGDRVLLSGTLGDHGIAIMLRREGIELESELQSDTAAVTGIASALLAAAPQTRCMRDPTRGGMSSALNEIAAASDVGIRLDEAALPIRPEVRGACELLGLDPLYVANEGKVVAIVPHDQADAALAAVRSDPLGRAAALIGEVVSTHPGRVTAASPLGGERMVAMLAGDQLPRIC